MGSELLLRADPSIEQEIERLQREKAEAAANAEAALILSAEAEEEEQEERARLLGSELHAAAMAGTVGWVEELLRRGAAVDSTDGAGWTALQQATNGGQLKAVACLLRNGADPNVACGQGGSTPLFWAPTVEFARLLLVFGASPGLIDSEGRTAEQWHLAMGREDVAQQIRMLQSPKFALSEAGRCADRGEMWMCLRLCDLGLRYYSVYDGKKLGQELRTLRRESASSFDGGGDGDDADAVGAARLADQFGVAAAAAAGGGAAVTAAVGALRSYSAAAFGGGTGARAAEAEPRDKVPSLGGGGGEDRRGNA
eukprot:COSAG01_NODE_1205_length_11235_cov_324.494124_10_plen_311_part_00